MSWSYHLDDVGVPNEIAVDPKGGDLVLFDADNERLGLVSGYKHEIMGAVRSTIDFSETPFRPHRPPSPPASARHERHPHLARRRRHHAVA